MRKWMRERLQRRKKKPAEPSDQPAPAPLQPAYFDAEPQAPSANETESSESKRSAQSQDFESAVPDAEADSPQSPPARQEQSELAPRSSRQAAAPANRGRRRRGGRGRGPRGREQAVAQAFAPAAVKGSIPATPAESLEEESPAADSDMSAAIPATPRTPQPASAPRPPKGIVVLAIGLPGSGKSSWFKRHNIVPLSSDMMRTLLFDDVREQRYQDLVFSNLRSMLKARLIARRPTNYVDATNLTPQERQHWIKLARDYQYEVHAVFFDVPLEVCIERHHRRDRVVPDDVMRRMAVKLKPPTFEEGFAKITVVRVKKKPEESASIESGL
jgi:predicted kinase